MDHLLPPLHQEALGHVYIEDDFGSMTYKVGYQQTKTLYTVISKPALEMHWSTEHLIHDVAKKMGAMVANDIAMQLKQHLGGKHLLQSGEKVYPSASHALMEEYYAKYALGAFHVAAKKPDVAPDWDSLLYKPKPPVANVQKTLEDAVPGLKDAKATCPAEHCKGMGSFDGVPVTKVVIHLNDHHRWTREKIADWLDTLDVDLSFKTPEGGES